MEVPKLSCSNYCSANNCSCS